MYLYINTLNQHRNKKVILLFTNNIKNQTEKYFLCADSKIKI